MNSQTTLEDVAVDDAEAAEHRTQSQVLIDKCHSQLEADRSNSAIKFTPAYVEQPKRTLKAALADLHTRQQELVVLLKLKADTEKRYDELVISGDIMDAKTLGEIGDLHVRKQILPLRIFNREEGITLAEQRANTACHEFISQTGGPMNRRLGAIAETESQKYLQLFIDDEARLSQAVKSATPVRQSAQWGLVFAIQSHEASEILEYGDRLLTTIDLVVEFGAKLESGGIKHLLAASHRELLR